MRQVRTFLLAVLATVLLTSPPVRAEVVHAAGFLVFLDAGKDEARMGTLEVANCEPRKIRVTIVRDRRTHKVVAGGFDLPVRWKSQDGLTLQMTSASFDPALNVFYGGALLAGYGLPGPARVRTLCFNVRGIVSMRGITLEQPWTIDGIGFIPTRATWDARGFHFTGTLDVQRQPKVEVTVNARGVALRGPLEPWMSLTGERLLHVDRFELLNGRIVAYGTFTVEGGRVVTFTRRPLKANADIDLPSPKPGRKPAPKPARKQTSNSQHLPVTAEESAMDGASDGDAPTVPALSALAAPPYPLLHVLTALVMEAARGGSVTRAAGFMPEWLAQADPVRVATATFEGPGLREPNVAGPEEKRDVPSRMTAASTWAEQAGETVPTGYVTLGPPVYRVYYKGAPVNHKGQVMLNSPSAKLYWQTRWASNKVYFPGGGTNQLELQDDLKWEQQEDFYGKRDSESLKLDDDGNVIVSPQSKNSVKPYFFTSGYKGELGGSGWFAEYIRRLSTVDRVQVNHNEFGQWMDVTFKKPLKLISLGNAYLALTFGQASVRLYFALLGPQKARPQSGLLFRSKNQVPGLAIYFRDGGYPFEFTRPGKEVVTALLRYTSENYFDVMLDAENMKIARVLGGLITIESPHVNISGYDATTSRPHKSISGTVGLTMVILKIFKGKARFNVFYHGDNSWGMAGTTSLSLVLWKFKLNLTRQKIIFDFGAGKYFIQIDTPIIDLIVFKVQNVTIQLQLGREAADLLPNGRRTDDNFTFRIGFTVKVVRVIPMSSSVVVWSDDHWELWWGKQRIPDISDDTSDIQFKDAFILYGVRLNGTYRIVKSGDGESVDQFVWTDPKSFDTDPTRGGRLKVNNLQVPRAATNSGNLDPSSGTLVSGTKVNVSITFEVPLGDATIRAPLTTELNVNPDGTASSQLSEVSYKVHVKDGHGHTVEETRKAKVRLNMRDGASGGGVMTLNIFPEHGGRVPYDFTCKNK